MKNVRDHAKKYLKKNSGFFLSTSIKVVIGIIAFLLLKTVFSIVNLFAPTYLAYIVPHPSPHF
jgi:hypothetical protein